LQREEAGRGRVWRKTGFLNGIPRGASPPGDGWDIRRGEVRIARSG